jgi:catechol 2,3-dioxygenase-like lactoylglutathione lyase family enzyme
MDYQLQVVTVPVTDVDQASAFYTQKAGFALDVDYHPTPGFRVVQLTPPGSACSIQIGVGSPTRHPVGTRHLPGHDRHRSRPPGTHRTRRQS